MNHIEKTFLQSKETKAFRALFIVSALWNFAGAIPGLLDPSEMFKQEFGHALNDPIMVAVYRGAWGTAFLYGFGFLLAAKDPVRHTGIVLMGGAGKALFALNLLVQPLAYRVVVCLQSIQSPILWWRRRKYRKSVI